MEPANLAAGSLFQLFPYPLFQASILSHFQGIKLAVISNSNHVTDLSDQENSTAVIQSESDLHSVYLHWGTLKSTAARFKREDHRNTSSVVQHILTIYLFLNTVYFLHHQ